MQCANVTQIRPVFLVHRPLDSLFSSRPSGSDSGSLGYQWINHQAVEVGDIDPNTGIIFNLTRFELLRDKRHNRDVAIMNPVPHANPYEYKGAGLSPIRILDDIAGFTSYTDAEIYKIANQRILEHGKYHLLVNSCQHWAVEFFNIICNVQVSKRAKWMYYMSEQTRAESYFRIAVKAWKNLLFFPKHWLIALVYAYQSENKP